MLINETMIYTETYAVSNPKGLIILTHGIALHSLYYRKIAELLNLGGYSVVLYDVRGHGKSQGDRGTIKNINLFIEDLHELIEVQKKLTSLPIYLMGHSMGGVITNLYSTIYDNYHASIILAAPTIPANYGIANLVPFFDNKKVKTDFSDERLSNIPASNNVDPYALKYFTVKLAKLVTREALITVDKNISNIKKPILVIHGEEDKLVEPIHSTTFVEKLAVEDKKLVLVPKGLHNLNHDIVTKDVADEIIKWLNEKK